MNSIPWFTSFSVRSLLLLLLLLPLLHAELELTVNAVKEESDIDLEDPEATFPLEYTLKNTGETAIKFLHWGTPFGWEDHKIFESNLLHIEIQRNDLVAAEINHTTATRKNNRHSIHDLKKKMSNLKQRAQQELMETNEDVLPPVVPYSALIAGKKPIYRGIEIKRSLVLEDFLSIPAGESLKTTIDVLHGYRFTANGVYEIKSAWNVLVVSEAGKDFTKGDLVEAKVELLPLSVQPIVTNTVMIKIIQALSALLNQAEKGSNGINPDTKLCSEDQQKILQQAHKDAKTMTSGTLAFHKKTKCDDNTDWQRWFKPCSDVRYDTIETHVESVNTFLTSNNYNALCGDPVCKSSYYAFVYPSEPTNVYLCDVFWKSKSGTCKINSQAGTLVHEISHFDTTADTDDLEYGRLAKFLSEDNKLKNADSHEYYVESCPYEEKGFFNKVINKIVDTIDSKP